MLRTGKAREDEEAATEAIVRPHPLLPKYYPSLEAQPAFVRGLFNRTADHYDRINSVFSLGMGGLHRRQALQRAGLRPGYRVLDVAVGTGLVAREAVRLCGDARLVTGLDLSENMLAHARRHGINAIQGRVEALPIRSSGMDFVCMGYALRHVTDLAATFGEFRRVLRPGGIVLLLEIGRPEGRRAQAIARLYLGRVVPSLCRLLGLGQHAATLMRYYWDTIEACVPPRTILSTLAAAGLRDPLCESTMGVFRAYSARTSGG